MDKAILLMLYIFISYSIVGQSADEYYKMARKSHDTNEQISLYQQAGNQYELEHNIAKALKCYQKAESIVDKSTGYLTNCAIKFKISALNRQLKRYSLAIMKLNEIEKIALQQQNDSLTKKVYHELFTIYSLTGENALSERYRVLIQAFNDDKLNARLEREIATKEHRIKEMNQEKNFIYESLDSANQKVLEKEKALEEKSRSETKMRKIAINQKSKIDVLQLENENKELRLEQQTAELKSERLARVILYGGVVLLLLIGGLIYYGLHRKKKDHAIISHQNKLISDSINYAKRIQKSLIPSEESLKNMFSDVFIIYEPKDVVSGDFPWHFQKGDYIYLAAVDCTGHGVPGAMLAVIGTLLLNDIVNDKENKEPGVILDSLHKAVQQTLKQGLMKESSNDGMDIGLCKYNVKTRELLFSGAHRPLYVYTDGEMTKVRGDGYPIGGMQYDKKRKPFNTKSLHLKTGDSFFISSDGLADQMERTYEKKYGNTFYDNIILPQLNQKNSFDTIKSLLSQDITNFKGDADQLDDILLIGVKIA